MPGLPYWTNSLAAREFYEPIYQNQFEVILNPPPVITGSEVALLVEHVTKLSGLPEINSAGDLVEQRYKFATRSYAGATPDRTTADLELTFTVNLNEENNAYIYNILRAWNDIVYNPLTGSQGLKRDYVGSMSVHVSNKTGEIFREWSFPAIIPNGSLKAIELEYTSKDVYEVSMKYRADQWTETRIGQINV
ncbi:MAG: hypothetical protein EBS34_11705 [Flavobacteriales bacterium]|nr:hypothetical protein [Flavobacteriales bacterium]